MRLRGSPAPPVLGSAAPSRASRPPELLAAGACASSAPPRMSSSPPRPRGFATCVTALPALRVLICWHSPTSQQHRRKHSSDQPTPNAAPPAPHAPHPLRRASLSPAHMLPALQPPLQCDSCCRSLIRTRFNHLLSCSSSAQPHQSLSTAKWSHSAPSR